MENKVAMVCHTDPIDRRNPNTSYGKQMNVYGDPHCVREIRRIVCGHHMPKE